MGCRVTSAEVTIFPSLPARFSSLQGLCVLVWELQGGLHPKGQVLGQELALSKGVKEIEVQKPSSKVRRASYQLLPSETQLLQSWLFPLLGNCWVIVDGWWEQ